MRLGPLLILIPLTSGALYADPPAPERRDVYGDPLPPGAVQRFGNLWAAAYRDRIGPAPDGKSILCLRYGVHLLRFDRQTGRLTDSATLPTDPASSAHLSADGRRAILFRGLDGRPTDEWEVWDLERRKRVTLIRPGTDRGYMSPAFSPDGRHVATVVNGASASGNSMFWVTFWDADTGRRTGEAEVELPVSDSGSAWFAGPVFSADGKYLVRACGRAGQVFIHAFGTDGRIIWDRTISAKEGWHPVEIGGKLLLPGGPPGRAIEWTTGEESTLSVPPDFYTSEAIAAFRGGKGLLYRVKHKDGHEVRAWDFERGAADPTIEPFRTKRGAFPDEWPSGAAEVLLWDDGRRVVDLKTRKFVGPDASAAGHTGPVAAVAFSTDGTRLVTVGDDRRINLWDATAGRMLAQWEAVPSPVHWEYSGVGLGGTGPAGPPAFDLSADGRKLVFAEAGGPQKVGRLRVADTATGGTTATRDWPGSGAGPPETVARVAFTPAADSVFIAFGDQQDQQASRPTHTLARWDLGSGDWQQLGTLPMTSAGRGGRAGSRWLVGGEVYAIGTGKHVLDLAGGSRWAFATTPDGRLAAGLARPEGTGDQYGLDPVEGLRIWDTRTGAALVQLNCPPLPGLPPVPTRNGESNEDPRSRPRAAAVWPRRLAPHPSGRWLATSDVRGVRLWDLVRERVVHTFPVPFRPPIEVELGSPATALAFSPDGSRLATGLPDGTVLVWAVPVPEPDRLTADELKSLWVDLVGADGARGWRAAWRLLDDPVAAVPLVRANLKPAERVSPGEVARLLADVDSAEFRRREAATRRLETIVDRVLPAVAEAEKAASTSAELRERLRRVLAAVPDDDRPRPTWAAAHARAVAVLEHARTPESDAVLRELAAGAPRAWLTREAVDALARMGRPAR